MKARELLIYISLLCKGDWDKITAHLKSRKVLDLSQAEDRVKALRCKAVTIIDPEYPQSLKHLSNPPYVLYYLGDLSLLDDYGRCIAYIGSREASSYGIKKATEISAQLAADGYTVISGLAKGIDAASARGAIAHKRAVAVIGNGLDTYYPSGNSPLQREIAHNGLLLSEYPYDTPPKATNFPMRNRIIAALANAVVVGEAGRRSGAMITVNIALCLGREVGCLPFRAYEDKTNNRLIKEGAYLIEEAEDVYAMLSHTIAKPKEAESEEV